MRLAYFLGETITNLRRNFLMTIAAISTVAISLLLLGGVQILGLVVRNVTLNWEAKVEISVYLRDDAQQTEIRALEQEVSAYDEVDYVEYVSKEEAYNEFRERYRNQPEFYENLPRDALPASLRIKLFDAASTEEVARRIEGAPGVDDIRFGGEIIKRLLQVNSLLRTITFVMSLVLMIAAAALIANAIRLAIYARREEIGIMKLVGATNWFIRIPFMLEGVFAALSGAIISGLVVIGANTLLFSRIGDAIPFMGPVLTFSMGELAGVLFLLAAVGAAVGLVGSGMALRRFLEV
jgi:cell division transport system permease protein